MGSNYAVIVTGDRYATEDVWGEVISNTFRELRGHADHVVLYHGDCEGIDQIAGDLALIHMPGTAIIPCPYISELGRAGGPARNGAMIASALPLARVGYLLRCLAFHDNLSSSRGTKDCANQAVAAGIKTVVRNSLGSKRALN